MVCVMVPIRKEEEEETYRSRRKRRGVKQSRGVRGAGKGTQAGSRQHKQWVAGRHMGGVNRKGL